MKNFMRIDTKKRQIIMDKTFYNKSLYFGTEEYDKLQTARKDYPGFTPVRREILKPDHPIDRHKGLTYVYMENYMYRFFRDQESFSPLPLHRHQIESPSDKGIVFRNQSHRHKGSGSSLAQE